MKRSEMVQYLKDAIYAYTHGDAALTDTEASNVLDKLERLGMLPPASIMKDPGHFQGDTFTYESNEWDPEDSLNLDQSQAW
jgi:hypothetical protein